MVTSFILKFVALLFALMAGVGMNQAGSKWSDEHNTTMACLIVSIIILFFV